MSMSTNKKKEVKPDGYTAHTMHYILITFYEKKKFDELISNSIH